MTTVLEEIQDTEQQRQYRILSKQEIQQVREPKYLTIDDIMPKWSHMFDLLNKETIDYLEVTDYMSSNKLFMHNYRQCAVGESHNFDDSYAHGTKIEYCERCSYHAGDTFPTILKEISNKLYVSQDWRKDEDVQNFVAHWNNQHVAVTKQ